jgi:Uma2 family endonuclease
MTATVPAIASHIEKTYTLEEYFELEKHSQERHEFVNGKLFKMPGESVTANIIADNCGYVLRTALKPKGYIIIRHDVRTIVKERKKYRYPDVAVGKLSEITETHAMTKPELLIEVSSYQSAKTDNETKVNEYVSMPSVQYYMIVSQYEPLVQLYIRDDQGWRFEVFGELTDIVKLPKLNCILLLSDIYESVVFGGNKSDI